MGIVHIYMLLKMKKLKTSFRICFRCLNDDGGVKLSRSWAKSGTIV